MLVAGYIYAVLWFAAGITE